MTLRAKKSNDRFAMVPLKHFLIKNVEDNVVFLTRKVFNFDKLSIASFKQQIRKTILQKTANEKKMKKRNHEFHTVSGAILALRVT